MCIPFHSPERAQRQTQYLIQCDPRPLPTRLINAQILTSPCDYVLTFNSRLVVVSLLFLYSLGQ
jgi:hypothetical protein